MEFAPAQLRTFGGAANLLGVPGPGPAALGSLDSDDEDCEVVVGIRPKSSPLPRRKTSTSDEECEGVQQQQQQQTTALSRGSRRRVCFADARGLRLALVKEFDSWDVPKLQPEAEGHGHAGLYSYHLTFPGPVAVPPGEELGARVRAQRIELESVGLLPGTTVLRGLVRVLNVSFDKTVFARTTLDAWASHFDLLAEYVPGSGDGVTDRFSFKLTLVPPFDERGARVDFCLRYETPVGTFWANNGTKNYVLFCHQRAREEGQEGRVRRKSCLKAARQHFTTVDNSSLEENVQSIEIGKIEKAITDVSKNGDALSVKSRPVAESRPAASEEERHKLATEESRRNASRRSERRAARQARLSDLFAQRDHGPEREKGDSSCEASLPEPPSDRPKEGGLIPVVDSTSDSLSPRSGGSSAADRRYASPAQSRGSSEAEKSESVNSVDPDQLLDRAEVGEMTAATQARHLEEELEQKQHSAAASITGDNGKRRPLESMGRSHRGSDHVCVVDNMGEESHSIDVSLAESTEAPVSAAPGSFTFGTVRAPLYPLVCGQVKSEHRRINQSENRLNPIRGRSMMGDSLENLTGHDGGTSRISRGPLDSHERKPMNIHLNDVPGEDGQSCVSVATDSSTNHADLDGQEPEHGCTGTPGHPQPATDKDTTPSDVNSEVLRACTTRVESLNLQGKAVEGQRENPSEKQILADADAAKTQAEAEEVASDIHMHSLEPTQALSQPRVLQGATDATPHTPHIRSAFVLACENQDMDRQICCDAARGLICTDAPSAQDGLQPTMTVSTTHIHPEQARGGIEPLERLDPTCLMCSDVDQSIPELEDGHGCSAADVSQETLKTSLEVVEEPINGGNESTNGLEEGDILAPTVEQEDIGDVAVCVKVKRKSCAHPDMLGKDIELDLVEKPVCKPTQREGSAFEDAATERDYFGPCEVRSERKNWEMMVEEEEEDALGEEVMMKEVAENGEKEMEDELREEQVIAEQQTSEEMAGCEKREHTETEFEELKHFCVTEGQSQIDVETVEEPLVWEEKEVEEEEEEVRKYADHGADNQRDVWEEIRDEEKETLAETYGEPQVQVEDEAERISVDQEERSVSGAGEGGMAVEAVEEEIVFGTTKEEMNEEPERPEMREHMSQNKAESDPSITPVSSVHEGEVERVTDKENSPENETTTEINLISGEEGPSNTHSSHLTNGQSKTLSESAATCGSDSSTVEKGSLVLTAEPECDPMREGEEGEEEKEGEGDTSSESASDEEMELYLHRLRAAPRPQNIRSFTRDGASGKGSQAGKRPSIDRAKLLPSSMPPISEAEHEEQLTSSPDTPGEMDVENFQAESTPFPTPGNQECAGVDMAQWTDAFSSGHILKSVLYVTIFLVFVVVAYHYDFLACFALYLLSILWLYWQSDTQPVTNNNGLTTR